MTISKLLNDFANRSFRDMADYDYIHARASYRMGLIPQFHWSALQTIEKYLKAILLYNRVRARDVKHKLAKALEYTKELPFKIELSPSSRDLIDHLDRFGQFRYLESSYFIHGPKLAELDKAVWEIRLYCRVLNYDDEIDGVARSFLPLELAKIEKAKCQRPQKFRIPNGALEKISESPAHPARPALIWQNGYYGKRRRQIVRMPVYFQGVNAPLTLHPELLDEVIKYIYLPKDVQNAYRAKLTESQKR